MEFSKGEAIAAQAEEAGVAIACGFGGREKLLQRMGAAMPVAIRAVLAGHRNSGPRRFANVERRAVAAEYFHRRPFWKHWN